MTPAEMAEVDANAPEGFDVLVERAATKVAVAAIDLMGGTYGRRVVVVAGPGNNGADGRIAAVMLRRRGVRVEVVDATHDDLPDAVEAAITARTDLVIDAAFGTGFRGTFEFPRIRDVAVLAVDIPSGVDGLTGAVAGRAVDAVATVTFAAVKPGVLFGAGASTSGQVHLADIGLDVSGATMHLVEDSDPAGWLPPRRRDGNKWDHATWIFAGSPGMGGAARLACGAAQRAGAGYVRHTPVSPGGTLSGDQWPTEGSEAVVHHVEVSEWADAVTVDSSRFGSVLIGPGLGRDRATVDAIRRVAGLDGFPLLIDGDGLNALGTGVAALLSQRLSPTVLTPHDREFRRLTGTDPGEDRIGAARRLAAASRTVVLLKGPTTIVADPTGRVLLSNSGDTRLATAGTGDVLSGIIAAHLAMGTEPILAAAAGAFIHGRAASVAPRHGLVARDLVSALPAVYSELLA